MTAAPPAKSSVLYLANLVLDPQFQIRERLDQDHVDYLAELLLDGKELSPIDVVIIDGKPHVVDGWHRVHAHKQIGNEGIDAIVHKGDRNAARMHAATANCGRGELKLKTSELRKAIVWVKECDPMQLNPAIAEKVGCTPQYVGKVLKAHSLETVSSDGTPAKTYPKIGRTRNGRTINTSRIGTPASLLMKPARPTVAAGPLPKDDDKDVDTDNWPDGWRELTVFHVPTLSDDLRDKLKALNLDTLGDLLREVKCNITEHGPIAEFQDEIVIALRAWNPAGDTTPAPTTSATEDHVTPSALPEGSITREPATPRRPIDPANDPAEMAKISEEKVAFVRSSIVNAIKRLNEAVSDLYKLDPLKVTPSTGGRFIHWDNPVAVQIQLNQEASIGYIQHALKHLVEHVPHREAATGRIYTHGDVLAEERARKQREKDGLN